MAEFVCGQVEKNYGGIHEFLGTNVPLVTLLVLDIVREPTKLGLRSTLVTSQGIAIRKGKPE